MATFLFRHRTLTFLLLFKHQPPKSLFSAERFEFAISRPPKLEKRILQLKLPGKMYFSERSLWLFVMPHPNPVGLELSQTLLGSADKRERKQQLESCYRHGNY